MQNLLIALAFVFSSAILAQTEEKNQIIEGNTVKVSVVNALNDNGTVAFAFYNKERFMKVPLFSKSSTIVNGNSTVIFENIPEGEYAIICFHDSNGNNQMDFQENGMPKESYGTSNNAMSFGPPQFDNSKFLVNNEDLILEIKF